MDFADDLPQDSDEERFRKHNRFLRSLKEDTLMIVDNFNATSIGQFSFGHTQNAVRYYLLPKPSGRTFLYAVGRNSDKTTLLQLAGRFFSDTEEKSDVIEQIIKKLSILIRSL